MSRRKDCGPGGIVDHDRAHEEVVQQAPSSVEEADQQDERGQQH